MKIRLLPLSMFLFGFLNISCPKNVSSPKMDSYNSHAVAVAPDEANSSKHHFPNLFDSFEKGECTVRDPCSEEVLMKDFFAESKMDEIGKDYVKIKIEEVREKDNKDVGPLELAVLGIDILHKDISKTHGNGKYTLRHEVSKKIEFPLRFRNLEDLFGGVSKFVYTIVTSLVPESTQTLSQFLSHESGKYEGDCDDFSRSFLTAYEIMKDIAMENKEEEFYSKLYKGLSQYRVIGVDIKGHSMNGTIFYSDDYTIAYFRVLEPQIYSYDDEKSKVLREELVFEDGKVYVLTIPKKGESIKTIITKVYSSEVCYGQEVIY